MRSFASLIDFLELLRDSATVKKSQGNVHLVIIWYVANKDELER